MYIEYRFEILHVLYIAGFGSIIKDDLSADVAESLPVPFLEFGIMSVTLYP